MHSHDLICTGTRCRNRLYTMLHAPPLVSDKHLGYLKTKGGDLWSRVSKSKLNFLVPPTRLVSYRVVCMTMGGAKNMQQVLSSGYVDDVVIVSEDSIPYAFQSQHKISTENYDVCMPVLIQTKLRSMCPNDILIFCSTKKNTM